MSKNPIINAISASAYIVLIVSVMNFLSGTLKNKPDTFGAPMIFLSLFTLSAAIMAYLFLYQPFQLFMDGKKKLAVNLFIQTMGVFGAVTVVGLILLLSGVI